MSDDRENNVIEFPKIGPEIDWLARIREERKNAADIKKLAAKEKRRATLRAKADKRYRTEALAMKAEGVISLLALKGLYLKPYRCSYKAVVRFEGGEIDCSIQYGNLHGVVSFLPDAPLKFREMIKEAFDSTVYKDFFAYKIKEVELYGDEEDDEEPKSSSPMDFDTWVKKYEVDSPIKTEDECNPFPFSGDDQYNYIFVSMEDREEQEKKRWEQRRKEIDESQLEDGGVS